MKILLVDNVVPDQTPHGVVSDLSLHYLPMAFSRNKKVENRYK